MEKRKTGRFLAVILVALVLYFSLSLAQALRFVYCVPSGITVTPYSIDNNCISGVNCELSVENSVSDSESQKGKLSFKLFGVLPLKTIDVLYTKNKQVRLGGFPVGLNLNVDGVLVDEIGSVETSAGKVCVQSDICVGDIILNLNNTRIVTVNDFVSFMDNYDGKSKLGVTLNRKGKILQVNVSPLIDELSGKYKLGLWVRDSVSGIGTTSFVKEDNTFASLGHGIAVDDYVLPITGGDAYNCEIVGVNKGTKGAPGELKGVLKDTDKPIGKVFRNTKYGVYGQYNSNANIPEKCYQIGSRLNVRNGKARIYTTVGGVTDFYDIEIIRAMPQSERADKSMVIRVTDKRLLDMSGGIVRGMSGSPIIQNDMVIGAITHVFVNDPTKGYGLYLDWMY